MESSSFPLPPSPPKKKLPGQEMLLLTMKTRALYSLTRLKCTCMSSLASEILSLFSDELFWQLYLHTPF